MELGPEAYQPAAAGLATQRKRQRQARSEEASRQAAHQREEWKKLPEQRREELRFRSLESGGWVRLIGS